MNEKINVEMSVDDIYFLTTCIGYWNHLYTDTIDERSKNILDCLSEAVVNYKAAKMRKEVEL